MQPAQQQVRQARSWGTKHHAVLIEDRENGRSNDIEVVDEEVQLGVVAPVGLASTVEEKALRV